MRIRKRLFDIALMLLITLIAAYSLGEVAWTLYKVEVERKGRGYVTDEVWYVSAARNILHRIFRAEPRQLDAFSVTVVFSASECAGKWTSLKDVLTGVANKYNLTIRADYSKLYAVHVNGHKSSVKAFVEEAKGLCTVVDVSVGWMLADAENIHEYINWEHPPLGKYLVALSMVILGDTPLYWRIPVITAGIITSILVYAILWRLSKKRSVSIIGALFVAIDPMSRALFSISLLDGYVALFTTASMYLAICKKYREALLIATIGGLFKATGLFAVIPVVLLLAREAAIKAGKKPVVFIKSLAVSSLVVVALYISLLMLASTPIIGYMGLDNWVKYALIGSIRWHLSIKCAGTQCPVSSAPWDWFIGLNSFPLYVYPDGKVLYAEGFYPLWVASLILLVFYSPVVRRGFKEYGYIILFYAGVLGGYILLWLLGGKTQYSFYGVQLVSLVYTNLVFAVYMSITHEEFTVNTIREWSSFLVKLVSLFLE